MKKKLRNAFSNHGCPPLMVKIRSGKGMHYLDYMPDLIVFIAGPYYGDGKRETIQKNIEEAKSYAVELAKRRVFFFCPHNHTGHFSELVDAPEEFYKFLDFAIFGRSAAIVALPRWKETSGSKLEIRWARKNKMTIFYPKSLA